MVPVNAVQSLSPVLCAVVGGGGGIGGNDSDTGL